MALAPREAGLHVWPHDSIGVVVTPLVFRRRDGSARTACDGPATRRLDAACLPELEMAAGMLHATTPGLPARLATGRPIAGYNGFDPTGPSLHVGHLVPIFGLLQLQRHGGRPVALVGGGTGMIGDPSGTSAERNLLDRETLEANVAAIRAAARAVPRLLAGRRRGAHGQQPRLARRDRR